MSVSRPRIGGFHRLLGTLYLQSPYIIQEQDEPELNSRAGQLPKGDLEAMGYPQSSHIGWLRGFILRSF